MRYLLTKIPFFPIWPELTEIDGVKIPVRSSPLSPSMRRRLFRGRYETAERDLVNRFVRKGDRILEIGASIGILTCFLAKAAGARGRIVCVEANAALKPYFDRQLKLNGVIAELVNVLCCPLWSEAVPSEFASQTFLPSADNLSGRMDGASGNGIVVPWKTAHALCKERDLEPTVVVVDIEGAERVWTRYPPGFPPSVGTVIVEFHPKAIGVDIAGRAIQAIVDSGFVVAGMSETVLAFRRTETG
ncbi:MAG: FkbM family methyltransferase [Deltaproteobacteria bacterium]|nr:FkbM family methyltransferase [Deltaproteobacteria bacterium]MDH3382540.1 FkbM family methyltransferase [Deltaproteobacteria bacterium]